jgi:predicted DNA-binding mobile mystery protein A
MATAKSNSGRARDALERRLDPWRQIPDPTARPFGGWVRAIREALDMTTEDLAARMHLTQSSVTRLEKSEKARTVQLDTLTRAAEALNCDLVYALVPRQPLDDIVNDQAGRVAMERLRRLGHTMALEQQELDSAQLDWNFEMFRDNALRSPGLWHEADRPGEANPGSGIGA